MNSEDNQLDIFSGDFQLPSIDQESLIVASYCLMAGFKIRLQPRNDLYYSKLPSLRMDGNQVSVYGAEQIIEYLESVNYNSEFVKRSSQHKFDIQCYKSMMDAKLTPCLLYLFWYDEENYNEHIGRWYAKKSPFPTNFIVPRSLRKESLIKFEKYFSNKILENDNRIKLMEKKVFPNAFDCLNVISKKLGDQRFMFGDQPTTLDAYVFSYLAMLYKFPVKKEIIKGHIRSSKNLTDYVDRILKKYFSDYQNQDSNQQQSLNDSYLTIKWSDVFFSGCVAAFLMIYYAFSSGIISTNQYQLDDYDDEIEEEPEQSNNDEQREQNQ